MTRKQCVRAFEEADKRGDAAAAQAVVDKYARSVLPLVDAELLPHSYAAADPTHHVLDRSARPG